MLKIQSISILRKAFLIGFLSFLFGTEVSFLNPQAKASPGFFEMQWDPEPGYKKLKYYQSSSERIARATYYLFLRGRERNGDIIKLTIKVPDYFDAKIKANKLSLCKVIVGGFTDRTRCTEKIPAVIEVNDDQTSIEVFPDSPIPKSKDSYAVVMKIFNPRKPGMFQFTSLSQQAGEIPISTYLGTWNITVQ